jgi:hypothetical protein
MVTLPGHSVLLLKLRRDLNLRTRALISQSLSAQIGLKEHGLS